MPPAAVQGSQVAGTDIHIVMVPTPGGPVPVPLPHVFSGAVNADTVATVKIGGQPAAVVGTRAANQPAHLPMPPGVSFQSRRRTAARCSWAVPRSKNRRQGGGPRRRPGHDLQRSRGPSGRLARGGRTVIKSADRDGR